MHSPIFSSSDRCWPRWWRCSSSSSACRPCSRSTCGNTRAATTRRSPSPRSTSERAPTWCAASSPRRWSAPSPAPTASITSNRKVLRADRSSPRGSSSTTIRPRRCPRSVRKSTRCAVIFRPRRKCRSSISKTPTRSARRLISASPRTSCGPTKSPIISRVWFSRASRPFPACKGRKSSAAASSPCASGSSPTAWPRSTSVPLKSGRPSRATTISPP